MVEVVDVHGVSRFHDDAVDYRINEEGMLHVTGFDGAVCATYAAGSWHVVEIDSVKVETRVETEDAPA